jgi:hypothetical protein
MYPEGILDGTDAILDGGGVGVKGGRFMQVLMEKERTKCHRGAGEGDRKADAAPRAETAEGGRNRSANGHPKEQ